MRRREPNEVVFDIKKEIPNFDREELLEYTKWAIPALHEALREEKTSQIKCKDELLNKIVNAKSKYRITKEIDHLTIQYAELADCVKENDETYIKVYVSIYFYDDVENNTYNPSTSDKYWNDIWYITYKQDTESESGGNGNCNNCGAVMEYDHLRKIFKCEYCGNTIANQSKVKWEMVDIEIDS